MIAGAMESGYNMARLQSNLDELTSTTILPATGPPRKFNKVGHILLHDAKAKKYFLLVTYNKDVGAWEPPIANGPSHATIFLICSRATPRSRVKTAQRGPALSTYKTISLATLW